MVALTYQTLTKYPGLNEEHVPSEQRPGVPGWSVNTDWPIALQGGEASSNGDMRRVATTPDDTMSGKTAPTGVSWRCFRIGRDQVYLPDSWFDAGGHWLGRGH